ncbi:glycosyltransferase family 39 protein [Streptomyces sp. NPDC020802]|uniref:glycosyltransferase family 39 protein n=1 Tax=Streptomyces sp. NPDC020802 TaxID=3365094 RepID=UPI0037B4A52C
MPRTGLRINPPAVGLGISESFRRHPAGDAHTRETVIATVQSVRASPTTAVRAAGVTPRRPGPLLSLLPVLLTLALGLWGVRRGGSLWRDEAVTYDMAHRSLPDLWGTLADADAVHGAYYLLLHALYALFGDADPLLVMRLPSVLATAVATAGVVRLGHRLACPQAGLLAGFVFALLPPVQEYAQEGRSYALVCALVVWATYALVGAVAVRRSRSWAGYGALMLAACLLHEFAVLALAAHAIAVPRAVRRRWAVTAACVVVGLAPVAVLSTGQSQQVGWIGFDVVSYVTFAGLAALGMVCARVLPQGTGRAVDLRTAALSLLVAPTAVLMLMSLLQPLYVARYVLFGNAGAALLVGAALHRAGRAGWTRVAVVATVLALIPGALHLRDSASRVDDVTAVARTVQEMSGPGDGILYMPLRRRVWSLPYPRAVADLRDLALDRGPHASRTLYGTEVSPSAVRTRMIAATRIVTVRDPAGQPLDAFAGETMKRDVLRTHFEECATRAVHGARVTAYARPGHC